ncbi:hypothetical protein BDN70DRAFT_923422 [Pholiota conissans]|uniref:Uncharacterized protein n=1 Tax=Pholiota conissans TaxID=109636 RepID=A0A9P5YX00_9AGAR|nr:hypothetical protein BDN70DRAFT_923422 [Pholiota conissans]
MDINGTLSREPPSPLDVPYFLSPPQNEEDSTDYVKWQGSQTTCSALNQLIKSSANESNVATVVSTSRGWQRQPSFDQIPGFSLLSTNDNPQAYSQAPSCSSSKSIRPSHSRPRPSLSRPRSPTKPPNASNVDLPIPLLDKSNPAAFLNILKGVSARIDENVGVKPARGIGSSSGERGAKRVRSVTSELQAGRPKKSRTSASVGPSVGSARPLSKGKQRAISAGGVADDDQSSMSELPFPLRPDIVEPKLASLDTESSKSRVGSMSVFQPQSDSGPPPALKRPSQAIMPPPPPPPTKHPTARPSSHAISPAFPSSSTTSIQPIRSDMRQQSTSASSKPPKPDPVPRYHPLLLEQQKKASSSSSSTSKPPANSSKLPPPSISTREPSPKPNVNPRRTSPMDSVPSSTPKPTSSQSSRPPALGMRRTHTTASSGLATSLQTTGTLPTRQKAFKPPLLGSSQSAAKAPASQQQQNKAPYAPFKCNNAPGGSNGSTSSESSRGSSTSASSSLTRSSSFTSKHVSSSASPSSGSSAAASPLRRSNTLPNAEFKGAQAAAPSDKPPPQSKSDVSSLPEPLDGDADSSFGDMMMFDLDALEETMKMYD